MTKQKQNKAKKYHNALKSLSLFNARSPVFWRL